MQQDIKEQVAQLANQLKEQNIQVARDKFVDLKKNVEMIMANSIDSIIEKFQLQLTEVLNNIASLYEKETQKTNETEVVKEASDSHQADPAN
jgi:molecular chaperone GrpE (heat shock protein)